MRFADDRDTHAHLAPHTQRIRIYVEKPRLISRLASTRVDTDVVQSSFRAVAYLTDARLEQGFEAGGEELDCFQPTPIRPSVRTNM
jgi:hypothetical protein